MSKARDIVETLRTVLVDGDVTNANFTGADLDIAKGGTGASTAGAARTALGVAIGTDVLAPDGDGSALTGVDSLPSQSSQSGKFLTTDGSAASWGTVAPAGLVLLGTVTGSNAGTISFGDVMSSTYHTYIIYGEGIHTSYDNDYVNFQVKTGGSFTSGSLIDFTSIGSREGVDTVMNLGINQGNIVYFGKDLGNDTNKHGGLTLTIHNPSSASVKAAFDFKFSHYRFNDQALMWTGGGLINNSSAITSIRFASNNGNIYGTFRIYGVSK